MKRNRTGIVSCLTAAERLRSAALAGAVAVTLGSAACGSAVSAGTEAVRREVWGFTAFWDSLSVRSVARNGALLDVLVTTWIALDTANGAPRILYADTASQILVPSERMALVTTWLDDRFYPATIRRLATDRGQLARTASSIAATLSVAGHRGAVLDFESLDPADLGALLAVVGVLADTLHARGLGPVTVAVPAGDTLGYPGRELIDAGADFILPMLYDQHWAGGAPGPVAAPAWVEEMLELRVGEIGSAKIVAGLPLYGYRWPEQERGVTVTFREATRAAAAGGRTLSRDSATGTLRASLAEGGEVWITDALLLERLFAIGEHIGVRRFALWYIGQEDPAIWRNLRAPGATPDSGM